jgi:hypothetical protein
MRTIEMLVAVGIGAIAAYVADPRGGRRRRALMRDQFVRAGRKTRDALDATTRDLANRTAGIVAATRARMTGGPFDDRRLRERVRAKIGHACSHPHAIDADATRGIVTLRGPVLADEVQNLLATVRTVPGVEAVVSELEAHDSADGVPALQGGGALAQPSLDILHRDWAPSTAALVTAAGLAATGLCMAAYARR